MRSHHRLRQRDRKKPVPERVVAEDVRELGAHHRAEAEAEQRPRRVLARRAAAEVAVRPRAAARALRLRTIEHELRTRRAARVVAPVGEEIVAEPERDRWS